MSAQTGPKEHFDVLIFHHDGGTEETLVDELKNVIDQLNIDQEVKIASTAEHFATGDRFESMEDALSRCSYMFILMSEGLLNNSLNIHTNNQILVNSITSDQGNKYIPVYESRSQMDSLNVPSYIKLIRGIILSELTTSKLQRNGLKNTILRKLGERKSREDEEQRKFEIRQVVDSFKAKMQHLKHSYEMELARLKGENELHELKVKYERELLILMRDNDIGDLRKFAAENSLDLSTLLLFDSIKIDELHSDMEVIESASELHQVDANPRGHLPVEHDEAGPLEHELPPPSYDNLEFTSTVPVGNQENSHRMMEAKDVVYMSPPASHLPVNVGRASPLPVPSCDDASSRFLPAVIEQYNSVQRSLARADADDDSMIVELGDNSSMVESRSNANLNEFEEDLNDSDVGSVDSVTEDNDMDTEENQVDLSLLDSATGMRPLLYAGFKPKESDGASLIVEVESSVGDNELCIDESAIGAPVDVPEPDPPMRVMHRSFCGDELQAELDNETDPLDIDVTGPDGDLEVTSPGLGSLSAPYSWPYGRPRRGSESGRRPNRSNLTTQRFLSLSSIQSLSSKLFRLHHQPSLNDISEMNERPRLLDGIRLRYAW